MEESESWFVVGASVGLETLTIPFRQFICVTFERSRNEALGSHTWADDPGCVVARLIGLSGLGGW